MGNNSAEEPVEPGDLGDLLRGVSASTIAFVMERQGHKSTFLRDVAAIHSPPLSRMVGRARTLRTLPWREDVAAEQKRLGDEKSPHRVAFDAAEPGDVLVIDARGYRWAAVAGDLLVQRLKAVGAAGLVTDGCVRDVDALRGVGLPVFAAGINSTSFRSHHVAVDINVPVACGGTLVRPGDYVMGDSEGVVVIPQNLAHEIATAGIDQERLDDFINEKLKQGEPLSRTFPPDEELMTEYRQRATATE